MYETLIRRLITCLSVALVLSVGWAMGLRLRSPLQAAPALATRYVLDAGGVDAGDCTDPNAPCRTVQYALAQAVDGDVVRLGHRDAPAVYTGTVTLTRSVTLEGGWHATGAPPDLLWRRPAPCAPAHTRLDAQGAGRVVRIAGPITPTLDCLTLTGGDAQDVGEAGGGVFSIDAAPIIVNSVITGNVASVTATAEARGGGVYLRNAPPTTLISGSVIAHNVATQRGTGAGGGLYIDGGTVTLLRTALTDNRATGGTGEGWGGGLYAYSATVRAVGATIAHNHGGGLHLAASRPDLERTLILNNPEGAGVHLTACTGITVVNSVIAHNPGGGIAAPDGNTGVVAHATLVDNRGTGVQVGASNALTLWNTLIVSHAVGISVTHPASASVIARYTLFERNGLHYSPGVTSQHEITQGAARLTPDYHLGAGSDAINEGIILSWVTSDVEGDARPAIGGADIGADESTCLARLGGMTYTSIQAAVDVAPPGYRVRVAQGTCYENLVITKTVELAGGWYTTFNRRYADPAAHSAIHGAGVGRAVLITGTAGELAPVLDGFTLTGGDATDQGDVGGGLYSWQATPYIYRCVISGNVASTAGSGAGGGLAAWGGTLVVSDSVVQGNSGSTGGSGHGGGLYAEAGAVALWGAEIQDNVASTADQGYGGGAAFNASHVTVRGGTVQDNAATTSGLAGFGGGVHADQGTVLHVHHVRVADNRATQGGGVYLVASPEAVLMHNTVLSNVVEEDGGGLYLRDSVTATLSRNHIAGNRANRDGGGAYLANANATTLNANAFLANRAQNGGGLYLVGDAPTALRLDNHVIADNDAGNNGGGLYAEGLHAALRHTTLARNGSGIYLTSGSLALTNTILVSHTVGLYVASDSTAHLVATLWGAGAWANDEDWGGTGVVDAQAPNLWELPGFVAPEASPYGDYHLTLDAPPRDRGVATDVTTDLDGQPRPAGQGPDLGADEVMVGLYLPLMLREF